MCIPFLSDREIPIGQKPQPFGQGGIDSTAQYPICQTGRTRDLCFRQNDISLCCSAGLKILICPESLRSKTKMLTLCPYLRVYGKLIPLQSQASYSFFQNRHVEVDQQAHLDSGQFEIRKQLRFMYRFQGLSSL